ncbi:MAG: energy-coupling factor transporter transmembrane protein EcfT [Nostoc sp. LLA-1]|nr:energy-coupling factor transporter transmembrane protein EcfT [Cyanocohniella sp. LLY]
MLTSKSVVYREGFLTKINPLLKITFTMITVSIAFALRDLLAASVLVGVLLLLLLLSVRIKIKILLLAILGLILFTALATWTLGDFLAAMINSLRLLAILLPTPLLSATTLPADLVKALQAIRLPAFLVLGIMLTWRFLPIIYQEAQRIIEANQLRGVDLSRQPQLWFNSLFVPLIFRIVTYADDVTVGLETRGYDPNSHRTLAKPLQWRLGDTLFTVGGVLLLVIVGWLQWQS